MSSAPGDIDLDVRPFLAHSVLSKVIPRSAVTVAWTQVRPGGRLSMRSSPTASLLIVLVGKAQLIGRMERVVEQGDVVTIPSAQEYGLISVGALGLQALHVTFRNEGGADSALNLRQLLLRNEVRLQIALANPFFTLLREGRLDNERKRSMMRECARVFSDAFQAFLFVRQGMCRDDDYIEAFEQHLREELGHNKLLKVTRNSGAFEDPILKAASSWFCHQMLVLDNVDKAVVNLVLETAGYYLGALAGPAFVGEEGSEFFHTHAEADADHKDVGARLLEGQQPDTYARLQRVLDSSWDMLDTMTRRIAILIENEECSS